MYLYTNNFILRNIKFVVSEDLIIFLSKEDAIKESLNYPNSTIQIFSKNDKSGYTPTYNYYENGEFIQNS